jgi:EAL domain-containing protein (putative c-di-GMP-specific phosphodiesterase class I)
VIGETVMVTEGEAKTFMTVTFALPDDEGRPVETCTIATDVTERRELEKERRERSMWEQRIGSALAEDRLLVFAQPIINLASGERTSSELLVRLQTPGDRYEILAPAAFLPAAERYGLIQSIDAWMVRQALDLVDEVEAEVNLSAVTLCDPDARREIVDLLAAAPEAAERITFEITETAAAEHLDAARAFAADASSLGCQLALDDFGTGFGSFTYLQALELDYLKIDMSFVRGLANTPDNLRVVQSIVAIAERFGLRTIAEGVEDAATLDLLRELGADFAQGFHLGRPAPVRPRPPSL